MKLKDWLETVEYRIMEGSEYCWNSFGDKSYSLTYWNGDHDGHSSNVVFDTVTQDVYTAEVCDYKNKRAYRWINPEYRDQYIEEVKEREIVDTAWDNILWTDLEVFQDWKNKTVAILNEREYDTRVSMPINLSDDELFKLMKMAHEKDITLNDLIAQILDEVIGKDYDKDRKSNR